MTVYRIKCWMTAGTALVVAGVFLTVTWPSIFHLYRRHIMVLANGSMAFNVWKELPVPIYTEFYLFNITNVDEILAGKLVKPRLQQMGPYVFKEKQQKVNIVWNANSTVTYQMKRVWHFQPDRSNGSLADIVTNIHPLIPAISQLLRYSSAMTQILANMITKMFYSNMFVSANASSWLFDGIESNLVAISSRIPNFPYFVPYDKIGWLYPRNNSAEYEKWFVVNTGEDDFSRFGKMEMWNHSNQTVYPGVCGEVRGSTGELWAPKKGQPEISVFASDLQTTLTLAASGPVTIRGVEGIMFVSNDSLFDNGQKYPSRACYCAETPGDDCMPSGVYNSTLMTFGAPSSVTLPHFRNAPAYYADKIEGLEPTEEHDFKMAIEMVTGMPMMARGQIQVSLLIRHSRYMTIINQLSDPDVLVPSVWVRQPAEVDEEYASFARLVLAFYYTMPYVFYLLIVIGVMILSGGLWILKYSKVGKCSENIEAHKFLTQCDSK